MRPRGSREALAIFEQELGAEHPRTIESVLELGWNLLEHGKYEEAELNQRIALRTAQRALGDRHRLVAEAVGALAFSLDHQGRTDEAESLNRRAVEAYRRIDGPNHPRTIWAMTSLGWSLLDLDRNKEAEELFLRSVDYFKDDEQRAIGNPGRGLARALVQQGRFEEAEPIYLWILEISNRHWPEGHRNIASAEREWGRCLTGLGRYEEAEEVLLRTYRWWDDNRVSHHRFAQLVVSRLVELYRAWEKPDEADEWRRRLERASIPASSGDG